MNDFMNARQFLLSFLMLSTFIFPPNSFARLGEQSDSIEADRIVLDSAKDSTKIIRDQRLFQVHEITLQGQTIREYVAHSGLVFAVTWRGMTHPDLNLLLGSYYSEMSQMLERPSRHGGRRNLAVQSSHVIVEKGGHMRDVHGRAYLPGSIPNGVSPEDIL